MADETGGVYRSVNDVGALRSVYEEIDSLEKSEIESEGYNSFDPLLWPFAFLALIAVVGDVALSTTLLRSAP